MANRNEVVVLKANDISDDDIVPRLFDQFALTQHL